MKFYAVNGSPRKNKNTATLLKSALDGIKSTGAEGEIETEIINLYDINFKSCVSCFQCKRLGGKSYGHCALNDELTPIIEKLSAADGIIFGSPIYYGGITGKLHSFFERFMFPYTVYDMNYSSLAPKKMPTAFIYTMNVTKDKMEDLNYKTGLKFIESFIGNIFSTPQIMYANNTYQFDDYSKFKVECFSESEKREYKERQFPIDCKQAFDIGASMNN